MAMFLASLGGSTVPKRLLRYVLSRLNVLESDALDLDNLDFAIGRNTTLEFRDVGLKLQKLERLADLPPTITLLKSKVHLLRITIPMDLYSSPIIVHVDGVSAHLKAESKEELEARSKAAKRGTSHDEAIPNTVDLAQSFLEQQPLAEKKELEAALAAETQDIGASVVSSSEDESDDDGSLGMGQGLSLPTFLAGFLQGILDRIQVHITNVTAELDICVAPDPTATTPELVTFKLSIREILVDGLTSPDIEDKAGRPKVVHKLGKRHIQLLDISAGFTSEANGFLMFGRSASIPPSLSPQSSTASAMKSPGHHLPPPLASGTDDASSDSDQGEQSLRDSEDAFNIPYELSGSDEDTNADVEPEPPTSSLSTPRASMYREFSPRHGPAAQSALVETGSPTLVADESRAAQSEPGLPSRNVESSQDLTRMPPHSRSGSGGPAYSDVEDLTQSHLFSHEEAESMYMSAFSHTESVRMRASHPGDWDSGNSSPESPTRENRTRPAPLALQQESHETPSQELRASGSPLDQAEDDASDLEPPQDLLQEIVDDVPQERPKSPQEGCTTPRGPTLLAKRILAVDCISLFIPSVHDSVQVSTAASQAVASKAPCQEESTMPHLPGAFSVHSAMPPSPSPPPSPEGDDEETGGDEEIQEANGILEVAFSPLNVQFDASAAFLLGMVASKLLGALGKDGKTDSKPASPTTPTAPTSRKPHQEIELNLEAMSLLFLEQLPGVAETSGKMVDDFTPRFDTDILLQAQVRNTKATISPEETAIDIESFKFGYAGEDASIISFDRSEMMMASVKDAIPTPGADVSIKVKKSSSSTKCDIFTLPLQVCLDLRRLDETFSWFGGFSSFLSMGSSITSMNNSGPQLVKPPIKPPVTPKGVRFDAPINPDDRSATLDNKINMRINGVHLDLIGKDCSFVLQTSAFKLISREEGIGIGLRKIQLHGPYSKNSGSHPPVAITISGTRVEYSMTPKDVDLERLLELISPSKLKFNEDQDEIMVETLLRQRKKGSVLRLNVDKVAVDVSNIPHLSCIPSLGEDLARLGTVAKYLPEDDRPGLLTLALLRTVDLTIDIGGRFGVVATSIKDLDTAHITVPSLVAVAVGSLNVSRNKIEELVGSSLLPSETLSQAPVLMMRMIGDVIEPTITLKMRGLNFEYRVPTIIDFLELAEDATPQDYEDGIAASVAHLGEQAHLAITGTTKELPATSGTGGQARTKIPKVDVAFLDCILGLNPLSMTSKMGIILADSKLEVTLGDNGEAGADLKIKKASIVLIDDISVIDPEGEEHVKRHISRPSDPASHHKFWTMDSVLCARGFVRICEINTASVTVQAKNSPDGDKLVEVFVTDEFFLLETCADSTQTLIALGNGLTPPTPPSKEIKFKTQIIPMEDMLSSISQDAFTRAEGAYNFDDDFGEPEDVGSDDDSFGGASVMIGRASSARRPYHDDVAESLFDASALMGSPTTEDSHITLRPNPRTSSASPLSSGRGLGFNTGFFEASSAKAAGQEWKSANNAFVEIKGRNTGKVNPLKVMVSKLHIIWNLYDGYDWQRTRDAITKTVEEVESKAIERRARSDRRAAYDQDFEMEEEAIGDFLFNSIYIGIPSHQDPRDLSQNITQDLYGDRPSDTESIAATTLTAISSRAGGLSRPRQSKRLKLQRSKRHKITFELTGVNVNLRTFLPGSGEELSSVSVEIEDLEIFDHVPTSTWRKFATYDHDCGERQLQKNMVVLNLHTVKPVPDVAATELVIDIRLLPLRLHVDQDALDFITRFFGFKDDSSQPPTSPSDQPFIQRFEIHDVPVRLDFKPKRVDYAGIRSGHTTEFMNFVILDGASMVMKNAILYGVRGFEKVGLMLNDVWMPEIKQNQLPGVLAGLAPVRPLLNVGSGLRHLVEIPVQEYRRDGRVVRSIGKGAAAFARTTGTELIKLGAKVAIGTQNVLQGAEGLLVKNPEEAERGYGRGYGTGGQGPSAGGDWDDMDEADKDEEQKFVSLYANQPTGVMQGLRHAYSSLSRDISRAREAIIAVPAEVMESSSATGAAKAVLSRAPIIIFRPAIGATKAIGQTLMGATNTLDPQNLRRMEDKYKPG